MDLRVLRYFLTVAKEQSYPMVQIALHTGTADTIFEMMNKGLVDIGLFMEPVNTEGLAYIRLPESDCWVVGTIRLRKKKSLQKKIFSGFH